MGLDVGSTTVKLIITDKSGIIVYKDYRRHNAETLKHTTELLQLAFEQLGNLPVTVMVTGSTGRPFLIGWKSSHIQENCLQPGHREIYPILM